MHGDILDQIQKPLTEVSLAERQQWVLQVSTLTLTSNTHTRACARTHRQADTCTRALTIPIAFGSPRLSLYILSSKSS